MIFIFFYLDLLVLCRYTHKNGGEKKLVNLQSEGIYVLLVFFGGDIDFVFQASMIPVGFHDWRVAWSESPSND